MSENFFGSIFSHQSPPASDLNFLATLPVWVAWQVEDREAGKPTKVPYNPRGNGKAKADAPRTWGTRAEAEKRAAMLSKPYGMGGVGLEFSDIGNGLSHGGLDLDSCRNASTGEIEGWAKQVIDRFASYTEVSPSGTGAKIFFTYASTDLPKIQMVIGGTAYGKSFKREGGDHPPAIELYLGKRFFAVTDQQIGEVAELRHVEAATILELIQVIGPAFANGEAKSRKRPSHDKSRSATAFRKAVELRQTGVTFEGMVQALLDDSETADWTREKGQANDQRELWRLWNNAQPADAPNAEKLWTSYLQLNNDDEPIDNLANAMTALRGAPELRDCFRFDEMMQVAVLVHPLPKGIPCILPRPTEDSDISIAQEWLQRHGLRRLGQAIVHQAVTLRGKENAFHPVRDYLNGLHWDRTPRLSRWLAYYAGCEPDEKLDDEEKAIQRRYISAIGRMFLISMVARVMCPGCKVDYMLILEGIQGEGKSTIGEILAGQWFSDSLPNIGSDPVRISQHMRGKWLIEIGELSAMGKTETEDLKAFLTRREEKFTPKYGRLEVIEPRQCVFMGTTNRATYLRDETGARRFWPAKTGVIDATALIEDRDQLFAEAVHAYRSDEQWWPDRDFEAKFIQPQQEARRETDAWEQIIGNWLETPISDSAQPSSVRLRTQCTVSEVAETALRMEPGRLGTHEQRRIAASLERLGWERSKRTAHGRPWIRREKDDAQ
ncbi:MAG: hypothetical protein NVSMB6_17740 [Burkholderiaceae bacterium]